MKIQIADLKKGRTPILTFCRHLLKTGYPGDERLEVYRGETLALTVRTVAEGAALTVLENAERGPYLAKYVLPATL